MTTKAKELSLDQYERKLAEKVPGFREAMQIERQFQELCKQVRDDLRQLRESLDITQREVAATLQMSQSGVSRFEKGEGDIGLVTVCKHAAALGLQPTVTFVPTASSYGAPKFLPMLLRAIERTQSLSATKAMEAMISGESLPLDVPKAERGSLAYAPKESAARLATWAAVANVMMVKKSSSDLAQTLSTITAIERNDDT